MTNPLGDAVEAWLAMVTPHAQHHDAIMEAFGVTARLVDADRRHSRGEREAIRHTFGDRLGLDLPADDLKLSQLITAAAAEAGVPLSVRSAAAASHTAGEPHPGWMAYRAAMDLAHAAAALDAFTGSAELDQLTIIRNELLTALDAAGVPRPGPADALKRLRDQVLDRIRGEAGIGAEGIEAGAPEAAQDAAGAVAADGVAHRSTEDILADLDRLVGMEPVKGHVRQLADLLHVRGLRAEYGLANPGRSEHLVFVGNPGTGKTTVGRIVGELYAAHGVVKKGHLVETDRSGLVAQFVGQTAPRVVEVCASAMDGILLVDEAYSLTRGGEKDFGREAIDALVKQMEDNRERLVVIVAGYPEPMAEFLSSNPGLSSRFPTIIAFPDFSNDELTDIIELIAADNDYLLDDVSRVRVSSMFAALRRGPTFGNARDARNLFEAALASHATRVAKQDTHTEEDLYVLNTDDVLNAFEHLHGFRPVDPAGPNDPSTTDPGEQQ